MMALIALLLPAPSFACDIQNYQAGKLVQVGDMDVGNVRVYRGGQFVIVGRLVGSLIQRYDGAGNYQVAGRYSGASVFALTAGQFNLVGKIEGEKILAYSGGAYAQVGTAVGCLPSQAAAGALLLVLRPGN